MQIDKYRHNILPIVIKWRKDRPHEDFITACGYIALSTNCPIIAIAYFIGETEGFTNDLNKYIKRLEDFYKN